MMKKCGSLEFYPLVMRKIGDVADVVMRTNNNQVIRMRKKTA